MTQVQPRHRLLPACWPDLLGALAVLVSRLLTMPRTFWESDEFLFASAVRNFDPWSSHPHPPGYPLYVGLGKFSNLLFDEPFRALVALSVLSCVVGYLALATLLRYCYGDRIIAACGAAFFYFSAAALVHGTLPLSDAPSLMFVLVALALAPGVAGEPSERRAILFGLACSAAIGTRPQLAIILVPLLFAVLAEARNIRKLVAGVASFTTLSVSWFLPLVDALGGWDKFVLWESRQAAYVAAHDAAASRGASTTGRIVARFLAHPWGPKWIVLPLFALALLGVVRLARAPKRATLPALAFSVAYFALAVLVMDPADAARYSLPHMIAIALLFTGGLLVLRDSTHSRAVPAALVVLAAAGALVYVAPVLRLRTHDPSPPVKAAAFVREHSPADAVVLYDLSMRPAVEYLLGDRRTMAAENGLRRFYDDPATPMVFVADGGSPDPDSKQFSWPESDAYGKMTRAHYRVVTVDPIRPEERFLPLGGIYALERNVEGEEWRWLARDASLRLPRRHSAHLALRFRLSHDAPYETNQLHLLVGGREAGSVVSRKGSVSEAILEVPESAVDVAIHAGQAFSPAAVLHNQDARLLAVQLVGLEQR